MGWHIQPEFLGWCSFTPPPPPPASWNRSRSKAAANICKYIRYKYLQIYPLQIFANISATNICKNIRYRTRSLIGSWGQWGTIQLRPSISYSTSLARTLYRFKRNWKISLLKNLFCNNNILPSILCDWQVSNLCSTMLNQPLRRRTSRKQWRSSRRSCTKKSTQGENFKHRSD